MIFESTSAERIAEDTQSTVALDDFLAAFFPLKDEVIHLRAFKAKKESDTKDNYPLNIVGSRAKFEGDIEFRERLCSLNKNRGIYFCPNTGGSDDASIIIYNAFFAEGDDISIPEQHAQLDACPLPTSIRVETRKSVHAYWLKGGACKEEEWRDVQERLIAYFKSDPKIKNPSRVMRLPHFNHVQFDPDDGSLSFQLVRIVQFEPTRKYTVADMRGAFPVALAVVPASVQKTLSVPYQAVAYSELNEDTPWGRLNAMLRQRIEAHPTAQLNKQGKYDCQGICHNGTGNTGLMMNPETKAVKCNAGCTHAQVLRAFGLPERPDKSFGSSASSTSYFVEEAGDSIWPTLDREKVLYGLAGEVVRTIEPHTEADTAALLLQFLTAFGNIVGRAAPFITDGAAQYPNLFTVIAGGTSAGKGTAWAHVKNIFKDVESEWASKRVQSGLSSGEGLIKAVSNEDRYSNDKRLMAVETEFSTVLNMNKREGNTLSAIIRGMWDEGRASTLTKNNPLTATNAHVSIIGHITPEELKARLSSTELYNGFANRFLWVCVKRSKSLPRGGKVPATEIAELSGHLKDIVYFSQQQVVEMERDEDADALWESVYDKLTEERLGAFGKATTRARPQVVRLSCIYALLDMSRVVKREHLEAALAVWQFCEDSARYLFGDSTGISKVDKTLRALRTAGLNGLARAAITTDVFKNNISAPELTEVLSVLQRHKLAFCNVEGSGRAETERWYAYSVVSPTKYEIDESDEVNRLRLAA